MIAMEDLARSAVIGLPSNIRNVISDKAQGITGWAWVGLTWVERYKLAKGFDQYLPDHDEGKEVLVQLPLENRELEEAIAAYGGSAPASPLHSRVRDVEKVRLCRRCPDL